MLKNLSDNSSCFFLARNVCFSRHGVIMFNYSNYCTNLITTTRKYRQYQIIDYVAYLIQNCQIFRTSSQYQSITFLTQTVIIYYLFKSSFWRLFYDWINDWTEKEYYIKMQYFTYKGPHFHRFFRIGDASNGETVIKINVCSFILSETSVSLYIII